jgi:hypothetical protein
VALSVEFLGPSDPVVRRDDDPCGAGQDLLEAHVGLPVGIAAGAQLSGDTVDHGIVQVGELLPYSRLEGRREVLPAEDQIVFVVQLPGSRTA